MFDTSFKSVFWRENEFLKENYVKSLPQNLKNKIFKKLTADLGRIGKITEPRLFQAYICQETSIKNKLHPMYLNYIFGLHEIEFPLQYIVSEVKNTIL